MSDRDSPENGPPYLFQITQGNDGKAFDVTQNGLLVTSSVLNRRIKEQYLLQVQVEPVLLSWYLDPPARLSSSKIRITAGRKHCWLWRNPIQAQIMQLGTNLRAHFSTQFTHKNQGAASALIRSDNVIMRNTLSVFLDAFPSIILAFYLDLVLQTFSNYPCHLRSCLNASKRISTVAEGINYFSVLSVRIVAKQKDNNM